MVYGIREWLSNFHYPPQKGVSLYFTGGYGIGGIQRFYAPPFFLI